MVDALLSKDSLPVVWTSTWRNGYGQLFRPFHKGDKVDEPAGGPDATDSPDGESKPADSSKDAKEKNRGSQAAVADSAPELTFKFAPTMDGLIGPKIKPPIGSDAYAIENGMASVTPLRATFDEPPHETTLDGGKTPMPFKL